MKEFFDAIESNDLDRVRQFIAKSLNLISESHLCNEWNFLWVVDLLALRLRTLGALYRLGSLSVVVWVADYSCAAFSS